MGLDENTRVSLAIVGVLIAGGIAYGALQFQASAHEKSIEVFAGRQDKYSEDISEMKQMIAVLITKVENVERQLKEQK